MTVSLETILNLLLLLCAVSLVWSIVKRLIKLVLVSGLVLVVLGLISSGQLGAILGL